MFAIVMALVIAGAAGWFASSGNARIPAAAAQVDPFGTMATATNLPTENYQDYSFVF